MASCQLQKPAKLFCNQNSHENTSGDTTSGMAQQTLKTCGGKYNQHGHEQGTQTLVSCQTECHSQTIMHHQPMHWNDKINHHQTAQAATNSQSHSTTLMQHQPMLFNEKISSHQTAHAATNSQSHSTSLMHHQPMHFSEKINSHQTGHAEKISQSQRTFPMHIDDMAHNHQTSHVSIISQSHSTSPMHHQSMYYTDIIPNHQTGHAATNSQSHFPSLHNHQTSHAATNYQSQCTGQAQGQHIAHQRYRGTACHGRSDKRFKEKIAEGKEIVKGLIKKKYRDSQRHDNSSSSDSENEGDFCQEKVNNRQKTYHISWTVSRGEKQTRRSY